MHGRALSRCLVIGTLFAFASGCSLSSDSDFSKISIRMAGKSPVEKLFAPFKGALTPPATTSLFSCLGVNVMGIGIPPMNRGCSCSGSGCSCGLDEIINYTNLPKNIAGETFCGYAGVTSAPITNDASPKNIKLTVPSGPKRIVEIVGVVDPGMAICNKNIPIAEIPEPLNQEQKPDYFEVGRAVVDLFQSKSVSIPDTFSELTDYPFEQAKRQINCVGPSGGIPPSYYFYIPTQPNLLAYWPMNDVSGSAAILHQGAHPSFAGMSHQGSPSMGSSGPLLQSADFGVNYALTVGSLAYASGNLFPGVAINGALSVEAWIKLGGGCQMPHSKIFEMGISMPSIQLHCLYPSNTAGFQILNGSSVFSGSTVALNDGQWHHIVGVYTPGLGAKLYVDGLDVSSGQSGTSVSSPLNFPSNDPFGVGGSSSNLPPVTDVAHVAVYSTALSSSEIKKHYNASGRL